ncbi:YdbH domain-containing protein [bacterium]|nr:YdbH domain-containing protein [bacterium]
MDAALEASGVAADVARRLGSRTLAASTKDGVLRIGLAGEFAGAKDAVTLRDLPLRATFSWLSRGDDGGPRIGVTSSDKQESATVALGTVRATGAATVRETLLAYEAKVEASQVATVVRRGGSDAIAAEWTGGTFTAGVACGEEGRKASKGAPILASFAIATGEGRAEAAAGSAGPVVLEKASATLEGSAVLGIRQPTCKARLGLAIGSAQLKKAGVLVSGLSADVPFRLNEEPGDAGRFAIGAVDYRGDKLPALAGTLQVVDQKAHFALTWPLLPGPDAKEAGAGAATLEASGWLAMRDGAPSGKVRVAVPRFELGDANQPADRWGLAKGHEARGTFWVDGDIRIAEGCLLPRLTVGVQDAELSSKALEANAQGVSANITLTSFSPLATLGGQRIRVREASLGKLKVIGGLVKYRIESPESILIESTSWGWAGGRLRTYALRFDPSRPPFRFTVYADRLKLEELLALVPDERITGTGELYGHLPVRIGQWPDVRFGAGILQAIARKPWLVGLRSDKPFEEMTPEERALEESIRKEGVVSVQFHDAPFVGAVLEQQDPRFRNDPIYSQVKERIVEGLGDLEYSTLRLDFIHGQDSLGADRLDAKLFLVGRGRRGTRQEFKGIVLNIRDFDQVLRDAILVERGVQKGIR